MRVAFAKVEGGARAGARAAWLVGVAAVGMSLGCGAKGSGHDEGGGGAGGSSSEVPDAAARDAGQPADAAVACTSNEARCSGGRLQTCGSDGRWGAAVACGKRQTCAASNGTATCVCAVDPVCAALGNVCASPTAMAACSKDEDGCFFEMSSSTCANGACAGPAGQASCCANACPSGATKCTSSNALQTCAASANGCTSFVTASCGDGTVCERSGTDDCVDPAWAEWPMPNNAAEVANGAPNLEHFVDNLDGTVTDVVTGLMWQQDFRDAFEWGPAVTYCTTVLRAGGYSDWRVPTIIELLSLADFGRSSPSLDTAFFPYPKVNDAPRFWSSTHRDGFGFASLYTFSFDFDFIVNDDAGPGGANHAIRCVR
jgi:hypothetical protein